MAGEYKAWIDSRQAAASAQEWFGPTTREGEFQAVSTSVQHHLPNRHTQISITSHEIAPFNLRGFAPVIAGER
jgi:hypothetical protein